MSSSRRAALAACVVAACGGTARDRAPTLSAVVPSSAHTATDVQITIRGADLDLAATRRIGGGLDVRAGFRAWLGATELLDVTRVDDATLTAVVPAGLSGDPLDLRIEGPTGTATLPQAFRASPTRGAILALTISAPDAVEQGRPVPVDVLVANSGDADALAVLVTVPDSTAIAFVPPATTTVTVPAGGSATVHFAGIANAPGAASLTATATGADAFTDQPVSAPGASRPARVLRGPSLRAVPRAVATVDVGETFQAVVDVSNDGDVDALAVDLALGTAPIALDGPAPAPLDIAAGATATFAWPLHATVAGPLPLVAAGTGSDAMGGPPPSVSGAWAPIAVQEPAGLVVAAPPGATLSVGQRIAFDVDVTNSGDADALAVVPSLAAAGGTAAVAAAPLAQDVPGHGVRRFTWLIDAIAPGAAVLTASFAGADANSGAQVTASAGSTYAVQTAAALTAVTPPPLQVSTGQVFSITIQVANGGQAAALGTGPAAPICTGTAAITLVSAPAAQDVAGGASLPFTWTLQATGAGATSCSLGVAGLDANSAALASATAVAPVQVQAKAALVVDSFTVPSWLSRGQTFAATLTVRNTGEATALDVTPAMPAVLRGGLADASPGVAPAALDIAGGATGTFTFFFTEQGSGDGTLALSTTASGVDGNSGAATVTLAAQTGQAVVEQGAQLVIDAFNAPSAVDRGTTFTASIVVRNAGEAAADAVVPAPPALQMSGGALASTSTVQTPVRLAGGQSTTFSWTWVESGSGSGALAFTAAVSGTDENSGAAVSSTPASALVAVQAPASLWASASAPPLVSVGQTFQLSLAVSNSGEATAIGVLPSAPALSGAGALTAISGPAAQDIPGLGSATFTWTYAATARGPLDLSFAVSGTDANSGASVQASSSSSLTVQRPAALHVDALSTPARLDRGQTFAVSMTVTNTGEALANAVTPALAVSAAGGAAAATSSAQTPAVLAGGASVTFTWTWTESGSGTGTLSFAANASAIDANSGTQVAAAQATAGPVPVERPALLVVQSWSAPTQVSRGQSFTVEMVVANAGDALARHVLPDVDPPSGSFTGGADAASATAQQPVDIPGGGTATFIWRYVEDGSASGTAQFSAGATGDDANTGGALVAPATSSPVITVQERAHLVVTAIDVPAAVSRGESFLVAVHVENVGEATALAVLPSPLPIAAGVTGGAVVSTSTVPAAVDLVGGATATFTFAWQEAGTAPGTVTFSASADGKDGNSGDAVTALALAAVPCAVQAPAALSIVSIAAPAVVSVGQTFSVSATIANTGQATARSVTAGAPALVASGQAQASTSSTNPPFDLAGGQTATVSWSYVASGGSGTLSFAAAATGTDANSGAPVAATSAVAQTREQLAASLSIVAVNAPSVITRGQQFTATVTVANSGEAAALGVAPAAPSVTATGGASAATSSLAAAVTIPGGQSATFAWTFVENGTASGTLTLSAAASGTDANSGAVTTASVASSAAITVQDPSQVVVASFALPGTITRGQTFAVSMTVKNIGGTAVNDLQPSPSPPAQSTSGGPHASVQLPLPAPVANLPPGGSATFTWSFAEDGTAPGTISFAGGACGTDAVSGLPSCANQTTTSTAIVQAPPSLAVTSITIPSTLSRGQTFTATAVVQNSGGATAVNVVPDPPLSSGAAHASVVSVPAATTLTAGASASFTWTLVEDGTVPGSLSVATRAVGIDANSGATVSSPVVSSSTATVQQPASLRVASLTAPTSVSRGQTFTVTMVVANGGTATAAQLRPSTSAPVVTATGGAVATTSDVVAPVTLGGGQTATFSWTYRESGTGPGTLSFSCAATGVDSNDGATLSAPAASTGVTVQRPAALAISSFTALSALGAPTIDRGQTFIASMTVTNTGDATAANVLPVPSPTAVITTGGAAATATSAASSLSIAGGASATFTWTYQETGTAPGTVQLSAASQGTDASSGVVIGTAAVTSNTVTVQAPAALAITSLVVQPALSRGQPFSLAATVKNLGGATATGVVPDPPSIAITGGAHATTASAVAPASLAAGASATFSWTYVEDGTATGTLTFATRATGVDANTGGSIASATASTPAVVVQRPAALSIASFSAPAAVSRGQTFPVTLVVANTGEAPAQLVVANPNPPGTTVTGGAAATPPSPLAAATIAGGTTATLIWSYVESGTGPGTLTFGAGVSGKDANSGAALSAPAASTSSVVQRPATLAITAFTLRSALGSSTIDRGQSFTATMTVSNTGDATATGVLPSVPVLTATGGASATASSTPGAAAIAGGSSASFRWSYTENGTGPGTLTLAATVSGNDGNSGATVSAGPASSDTATVQAPAALAATFSVPSAVTRNAPFTISLKVTNTGGATAANVAPGPLSLGGVSATITSGPSPLSATIPGGGNVTFAWSCLPTANGTLSISGSVAGTDVNDGTARTRSASASTTVNDLTLIATNPFGDGTAFAYVFDFNGRVYLGPRKDGSGAVRMLPDGTAQENVSFTFNEDFTTPDANKVSGPFPSLGYSGCNTNTLQCGPDNENGRGLFTSGVIAGTPWLFAGGSASGGNLLHLYATTDTMTAPDFDYIGMKNVWAGETQGTSSMLVFHDRIYVGAPSNKSGRPYFAVINRTPPTPGYDVSVPGDAVNLGANRMPGFGSGAGNNAGTQMIDSMAAFNDLLYIANNGGIWRSTNNAPRPYTSFPSDWSNATPSAFAYIAQFSTTTFKLGDLTPADRAFPQMAALNGRLYAARNTGTGPQLWVCNPGSNLGCDPSEWSLLAGNSFGDPTLSQFNNPRNTSVSLLVATAGRLYVGFDNGSNGAVIFRSTTATPQSRGDFEGLNSCLASSTSCQGLGGNGFGAGMTRIFDARVLTYSGIDWVYVVAGTGSAVRVFRTSG